MLHNERMAQNLLLLQGRRQFWALQRPVSCAGLSGLTLLHNYHMYTDIRNRDTTSSMKLRVRQHNSLLAKVSEAWESETALTFDKIEIRCIKNAGGSGNSGAKTAVLLFRQPSRPVLSESHMEAAINQGSSCHFISYLAFPSSVAWMRKADYSQTVKEVEEA